VDRVHTATSRWPSLISSNDHPAHTRPAIPQCQTRPGGLLPKPEQNHARTFNWPKTMTCIWPPAGTSNWPLTHRDSGLWIGSTCDHPEVPRVGMMSWIPTDGSPQKNGLHPQCQKWWLQEAPDARHCGRRDPRQALLSWISRTCIVTVCIASGSALRRASQDDTRPLLGSISIKWVAWAL